MSQIISQIKKSELSKKGQTNPSGKFEGTPENVAAVTRSAGYIPRVSTLIPPIQNPIDVTYENGPQLTYLDFLRSSNKI